MAKILDVIERSGTPPSNINSVWFDGENLNMYKEGKWQPISASRPFIEKALENCILKNDYSFSVGEGEESIVVKHNEHKSTALGKNSLSLGVGTETNNDGEVALGHYNKSTKANIKEFQIAVDICKTYDQSAKSFTGAMGSKYLPRIVLNEGIGRCEYPYIIYNLFGTNDEYEDKGNGSYGVLDNMDTRYYCEGILDIENSKFIVKGNTGRSQVLGPITTDIEFNIDIVISENELVLNLITEDVTVNGWAKMSEYKLSYLGNIDLGYTLFSLGAGSGGNNRKNIIEINRDGKVYIMGIGDYDGTNPTESEDLAKAIANGGISMTNVTYDELVSMRDNSQLKAGMFYRITDFVTTTAQENTQSASHQFDLIVTADDESTLNEKARAIQHDGDEYFANSNLAAWEIWYCLNNDTERFAWADAENGKGVIYRMIDEFNNDIPYDFKNIQFRRGIYAEGGGLEKGDGDGDFEVFCYTFSFEESQEQIIDTSIYGNNGYLLNDEMQIFGVYGNIIKPYMSYNHYPENPTTPTQVLNNIVFFSSYMYEGLTYYGCFSNSFGNSCYNISFGNYCYNNSFGDGCYSNSFGDNCYYNSFGNDCRKNTFGDNCYYNSFGNNCFSNSFGNGYYNNSFGDGCYSNSFGNVCGYNSFGDYCFSNSFGNNCHSNSFGNNCYNNSFGNYCQCNSFGDDCNNNSFGDDCYSNSFGNGCYNNSFRMAGDTDGSLRAYCRYIHFDDGCSNNIVWNDATASYNSQLQNINVNRGVSGTSSSYNIINISTLNSEQEINISQVDGIISIGEILSIKYESLVNLRDNGHLVPGQQYRIIDYATTTVQANTQSASHQFDLIVTADNENTLNEVARACHHKFDLEKYKDAYSHTWGERMLYVGIYEYEGKEYHLYDSDSQNLQMLMDFNSPNILVNELLEDEYPYIFFPVYCREKEESWGEWIKGTYFGEIINFKYNLAEDTYFFDSNLAAWQIWYCLDNDTTRFAWADTEVGKGVIYRMIDEFGNDCPYDFKNIMFIRYQLEAPATSGYSKQWVNQLALNISGQFTYNQLSYIWDGIDEYDRYWEDDYSECYSTNKGTTKAFYTFSNISTDGNVSDKSITLYCYNNVIKEYTISWKLYLNNNVFINTFDTSYCYFNSFGDGCHSNSFGDSCFSNSFGNGCYSNSFGDGCRKNTFGNGCCDNSFGNYCRNNFLRNECQYNSFGNDCRDSSFGNGCQYNSFGNDCQGNSFRGSCYHNSLGNKCIYNSFGNSCGSNFLDDGEENPSTSIRYYKFANDVSSAELTVTRGLVYETMVAKDSEGNLKVFCLADIIANV